MSEMKKNLPTEMIALNPTLPRAKVDRGPVRFQGLHARLLFPPGLG